MIIVILMKDYLRETFLLKMMIKLNNYNKINIRILIVSNINNLLDKIVILLIIRLR